MLTKASFPTLWLSWRRSIRVRFLAYITCQKKGQSTLVKTHARMEDAIFGFQKLYQKLLPEKRLEVELLDIPAECSKTTVTEALAGFNGRYQNSF